MHYDTARTGTWGAILKNSASSQPTPWVQQAVVIPDSRLAVLSFWHRLDNGGGVGLTLRVLIDGIEVSRLFSIQPTEWTRTNVDVTEFADGGSHVLRFEFSFSDSYPSFVALDDVTMLMGSDAQVDLTYSPRRSLFAGTVQADPLCRADRDVVIKRVRPGRDRAVDRGETDEAGRFRIAWAAKPGRYYAVVPVSRRAEAACLGDSSPRLTVR